MATSGSSQLPGRFAAAAAVALILCAGAASPAAPAVSASTASTWCAAQPTAAWKKALSTGVVALSRRAPVTPRAMSGDGRTFFAQIYTKAFAGVVRLDARTSRFTRIKRFPDAVNDQAGGAFDGRWLVWDEYHSLNGLDDFSVWSWDSRTGRVQRIGAATRGPSGDFWPSPWREPDVRDGIATWTQGTGANGLGDVHVVDLATGKGRVVRHGHVQGSFLTGAGLVVWPESLTRGATTIMQAAAARTGRPARPPLSFRGLRGVSGLATDGSAIAYPSGDYTALWWSPAPGVAPRQQFRSSGVAYHVDNSVQVAGRHVAFTYWPHLYLVDTDAGRYVSIAKGGWTRLDSKALVMETVSARKALHAISDVVFLRWTDLPAIPRCR